MTYMEQFEAELVKRLESDNTATLVRWITEKHLESYRNGITAGRNGVTVKRHGQSRRKGLSTEGYRSKPSNYKQ